MSIRSRLSIIGVDSDDRQLLRSGRSLNMRHILVVFLADVFHEFVSGLKSGGEGQLEWPGVCTRIVDRDFVDQSSKILSRPAFNRVQFCRVDGLGNRTRTCR